MSTKIMIAVTVEGGVVQKVCAANANPDVELEVMVIDHDTQSGDAVVVVPYLDGNDFPAYVSSLPVDPVDFDIEKLVGLKEAVWGTYWCEVAGGASCN